jgi:ATP-dependent helicase YprA (DUF1998 family)
LISHATRPNGKHTHNNTLTPLTPTTGTLLNKKTQAAPAFRALLASALDLVRGCGCRAYRGCPACVQSLECRMYNAVLWKRGAEIVLQAALEQQQQDEEEGEGEQKKEEEGVGDDDGP